MPCPATTIASRGQQHRHEHNSLVVCKLGHLLQYAFGCSAYTGRRNQQRYWCPLLSLYGSNGAAGPELLPARITLRLMVTWGLKHFPEVQPPKQAS